MEARLLHRVVSSLFETESHNLVNDEEGNPIYTAESWNRISRALDTLDLPFDECPYDYPEILGKLPWIGLRECHANIWYNSLTYCRIPFAHAHTILALTFPDESERTIVLEKNPDVFKLRYLVYNYRDFASYCTTRAMSTIRAWIEFYYGMQDNLTRNKLKYTVNFVYDQIAEAAGRDNVVMVEHGGLYYVQQPDDEKVRMKIMGIGFPIEMYTVSGIIFGQKRYIVSDHGVVRTKGFPIK